MASRTPRLHKDLSVEHCICGKFDASADSSGKKFDDALPNGAIITRVRFGVSTVFGGTTPGITLGWSGDTDALGTTIDTDVANTGIKWTAAGTLEAASLQAPLTASKEPLFTKSGTSVTTGVVHAQIFYVFPHYTQYDN